MLCSRLVERIQFRFVPAAILWQEVEGPVDADVADELIGCLPVLTRRFASGETILDHVLHRDRKKPEPSPLRAMLGAPASSAQRMGPAEVSAATFLAIAGDGGAGAAGKAADVAGQGNAHASRNRRKASSHGQ